jgi:4-carboxymuconolactone decarboxylase
MTEKDISKWYTELSKTHGKFIQALEGLGKAVREEGPLDEKTSQLIQLAAAASSGSEGAVHSHVKRAMKAGATSEEIRHALILLTSTIGFPKVSAALSWVENLISK